MTQTGLFPDVKKCDFHLLSEFGPRGQQWRGVNFSNFIPGGWWGTSGRASIDIEDLMIYCNAFLDAIASLRPMMEIYWLIDKRIENLMIYCDAFLMCLNNFLFIDSSHLILI